VFCKRAYPVVVCGEIWIFQGESTVFTCGPHMMRTTAKPPDRTPIPVPWSAPEFTACLFPLLSMPQRGPRCKLGSPRLLHLRLWGLLRQRDVDIYTGDIEGTPVLLSPSVHRMRCSQVECCGSIDAGGALRQAVKRIVKLNGHRSVLAVRNSTPLPD
jgi:hypothetical protein